MKKLVKAIRLTMDMNQDQFALAMGVSPVTVSRWENGKAAPSLMAQKQLYDLCKSNSLNLADYIVSNSESKIGDTILYHASRKGIEGTIKPISRSRCDFGKGFYMGTEAIQPLTLVCNEDKPKFYQLKLNLDGLKVLNVDINLDWAMLIAYFRGYMRDEEGSTLYEKYAHMADGYDIIVGYIANDRMYQVLTDFFERRITDTALIASLSALKLGKQYVAVTQKACNQITVLDVKTLSKLELMILRDISTVRRDEGITLARQMVSEHRRDGLFFDEIMRGVEVNG